MLNSSNINKTFDLKNEMFERQKYLTSDRLFFIETYDQIKPNQQSEEVIIQYKQNLLSEDPNLICQSITFFSRNIDLINQEVIQAIFSNINKDFDISDCICGFIDAIDKRKRILCNPQLSNILVDCIIAFSNSEDENQDFSDPEQEFKIKSYEALSNLIFINKDVAISLHVRQLINKLIPLFQCLIESLMNADSLQQDNIDTHFSLIESLFRLLCSFFNHPDVITTDDSNHIILLFHLLLSLDRPDLNLRIKTFAFDNIYWFAFSAPDEVLQSLLTPLFIQTLLMLLQCDDQEDEDLHIPVKLSVFQAVERITLHGEPFSLFFVQDQFNILETAVTWPNWSDDTKFSFVTILRNFTTISNLTPTIKMLESTPIIELFGSILNASSFRCQKEVCIVICHILMYNQAPFIIFVLSKFSSFFGSLLSMINKGQHDYLARVALSAILVSLCFLETQDVANYQKFIEMILQDDLIDILDSVADCEDENLSNLSAQIKKHLDG